MTDLNKVFTLLNNFAPCELKEDWDNVGLIVGDMSSKVNKILVALDCTVDVINEAVEIGADLIVSHHPMIFKGINRVDFNDPTGRKIKMLIKNDINLISMHTNLDKAKGGVNDALCEALELNDIRNINEEEYSFGRTGTLGNEMTLKDFVLYVKEKLGLPYLSYVGNEDRMIKTVSVSGGAGPEFYVDALETSDVFISSEVKHHIGIEVMERDFAIIDAGHFETENPVTEKIYNCLKKLQNVEVVISKKYKRVFKRL